MIEFYPQIKWLHVAAVIASGGLFLVRGVAVKVRAGWAMAAPIGLQSEQPRVRLPNRIQSPLDLIMAILISRNNR